jgi:ubiquinone/menaquinone biosynthesis C-methylase UbiE
VENDHQRQILEQFTKQAAPFAAATQIRSEQAIARIIEMAGAGPDDVVLDVACGPGLLACGFARVVKHVTGIDLTPRMLQEAQAMQRSQKLENMEWREGDVEHLPYSDGAFSIVVSRFAFHHFTDPQRVLLEMRRVCRSGGRVLVADSAPEPATADAFNAMERLRDPSHTKALSPPEFEALFASAGLISPRYRRELLPYELENLLARSFPEPGNADRIRHLFRESLKEDRLGVSPVASGDDIRFLMPTMIFAATAP